MSEAAAIARLPYADADLPPLVPEGEYSLKLLNHSTAIMFGKSPRLVLTFSIVDFGDHHGLLLPAYYNVERLTTKAGKSGKCKHKKRGNFTIDYCNLFPTRRITRLDQIPMEPLYQHVIVGKVRDVKTNSLKRELPEQLKYSVVAELVRVAD